MAIDPIHRFITRLDSYATDSLIQLNDAGLFPVPTHHIHLFAQMSRLIGQGLPREQPITVAIGRTQGDETYPGVFRKTPTILSFPGTTEMPSG